MPVSKNRKNHSNKAAQYKQKVVGEKKRAQETMMKFYQEQQLQQSQMKQQINGMDVENTDIVVDDLDLGIDMPVEEMSMVDVSDFNIIPEEYIDVIEEKNNN